MYRVGPCILGSKTVYVRVYKRKGPCYFFPAPRMEVLSFLITFASAVLQLPNSRNERQSLLDNKNMSVAAVGLSCALHKNWVGGRWRSVCACRLARAK